MINAAPVSLPRPVHRHRGYRSAIDKAPDGSRALLHNSLINDTYVWIFMYASIACGFRKL